MSEAESVDELRQAYLRLLNEYGDALRRQTGGAPELLEIAGAIWKRIGALGGVEAEAPEMHRALALFHAVAAGDSHEAKRLYDGMSRAYQNQTDMLDAHIPTKLWLRDARRPSLANANANASFIPSMSIDEYDYWRHEVQRGESALACQYLGIACERLGRFEEACDAYGRAAELASECGDESIRAFVENRIRFILGAVGF